MEPHFALGTNQIGPGKPDHHPTDKADEKLQRRTDRLDAHDQHCRVDADCQTCRTTGDNAAEADGSEEHSAQRAQFGDPAGRRCCTARLQRQPQGGGQKRHQRTEKSEFDETCHRCFPCDGQGSSGCNARKKIHIFDR